jgi:hypothetical protein
LSALVTKSILALFGFSPESFSVLFKSNFRSFSFLPFWLGSKAPAA